MQIQTDNLCQFLPQDVVREFPAMRPSDIFLATVRAVGEQDVIDLHAKLESLQSDCAAVALLRMKKVDSLAQLKEKRDSTADIRKAAAEMKETEERIAVFVERERYSSVLKSRTLGRKKKEEINKLNKEKADLEEGVQTLKEEVSKYRAEHERLSAAKEKQGEVMRKRHTDIKNLGLEKTLEDVDQATEVIQSLELDKDILAKEIETVIVDLQTQ